MSLPDELVDHILSFLQSDLVTLKKCAEAHPILSRISERYIYAKVALYDDFLTTVPVTPPGLRTTKFAQIIAKTPNITNHIRDLEIYINDGADPGQSKATASHLKSIASMLPAFSRMKTIALRARISWHTLPEIFRQAFQHLIHVQCMKNVSIFHMSFFPLSMLNNCETLTLHNCKDVQYEKEPIDSEDRPYRALEHLSIQHSNCETLEKITSWVQMHSLRSLAVILDDEFKFRDLLPQLLSACSSTLINLDLDLRWYSGCTFPSVEFHFLSGWPTIPVDTLFRISPWFGVECLNTTLFPFTLAGLFHLERLTIRMDCALHSQLTNDWDHYSPTPAITELISNASSNLKQLVLQFALSVPNLHDLDIIWAPVIPLVEKCSSLSITVSVCAKLSIYWMTGRPPLSQVFSSLSGYGGLKPYVENGVFTLIPEID